MSDNANTTMDYTVQMLAAVSERLGRQQQISIQLRQQLLESRKEIANLHRLLRRSVDGEAVTGFELAKSSKKKLPAPITRGYVETLIGAGAPLPSTSYYSSRADTSAAAATATAAKTSKSSKKSHRRATPKTVASKNADSAPPPPPPTPIQPSTSAQTDLRHNYEPISDVEVRETFLLSLSNSTYCDLASPAAHHAISSI